MTSDEDSEKKRERIIRFRRHVDRLKLNTDQIKLIAYLGYQPAIDYTDGSVERPEKAADFIKGFVTYGHEAAARACITLGRDAMRSFEAAQTERVPAVLRSVPRELVMLAERRIDKLDSAFEPVAARHLESPHEDAMLLAEQDGLLEHAAWFSICTYALMATGPQWKQILADIAADVAVVWRDEARIIRLIAGELQPWSMGIEDMLKQSPTTMPAP